MSSDEHDDTASDSTLPSIKALTASLAKEQQVDPSAREDLSKSPEEPDPAGRSVSPAVDRPGRENETDAEASPVLSPPSPTMAYIPQPDEAYRDGEARRNTNPDNDGPGRLVDAASTPGSFPEAPRSHVSPSPPQEKGVRTTGNMPCESEAVSPGRVIAMHRKATRPRRAGRQRNNNVDAPLDPNPDATCGSDSDAGRTTFQLQFDWDPCVHRPEQERSSSRRTRSAKSQPGAGRWTQGLSLTSETGHWSYSGRTKRFVASRAPFTLAEDRLIVELKEGKEKLSWLDIHKRLNTYFPARTLNSLQVHYCTKLKRRGTSDAESRLEQQTAIENEESHSYQVDLGGTTFTAGNPMLPVDPALWVT